MVLLAVAVGLVVAACGGSSKKNSTTAQTTAATGSAVATTWSLPNANAWNTRAVASEITTSNVTKLKPAWTIPITGVKGLFGVFASTPVFSNGVVYLQDLGDNVYAVNETSGAVEWKWNAPKGDSNGEGPNGVTVVNGVVYGETETAAFALQATTGEQLWKTSGLASKVGQGFNIAPMVTDGTEYLSTSGQKSGGVAYALNADTGKRLWSFQETKDPSERTLGGVDGTGGAWGTPLVIGDSVYMGVANPYRSIDDARLRATKLLYNDSTVSLNTKTGKLQWYYQAIPNDFHDWDMQIGPMYSPDGPGGQPTVIDAGKMGFVYAYNAKSGKLLWKTSVGKHNGHDNDSADGLKGSFAQPKLPYTFCPGVLGGVETQMAMANGVIYVPINNLCSTFKGYNQPIASSTGVGGATGGMEAVSLKTGKVLWNTPLPHSAYGAATYTNGVVFTTTFDGKLIAFNAKTGKQIWSSQLSAGTNSPLAIDGNMLVTAASFDSGAGQKEEIVAYSLNAPKKPQTNTNPGSSTSTSASSSTSTSGSSSSTSTGSSSSSSTTSGSSSASSSEVSLAEGVKIFTMTCGACHTLSEAGTHGAVGPNLDQLKPSDALVIHQVTNGGGGMPAFGKTYSKTQIESVAKFVSSYAGTGKKAPGASSGGAVATP
jgi:outer membrane protein assembly factor BamB